MTRLKYVVNFDRLGMGDVERVGGKNASLGEMIVQLSKAGIRVPGGFATTAAAFREFLAAGGLASRIEARLKGLDADDVEALGRCGAEIRGWIEATPFAKQLEAEIGQAFRELTGGDESVSVAVRSSATAEDLPDASFAGQQETFLNIRGLANVMTALKHVFASLYNDRAISYRCHKGFGPSPVALSAGVQRMVRSDLGASGVMFTLDTESGFRDVVFITASWGLRIGRARRGQPRRVLRPQADVARRQVSRDPAQPRFEIAEDGICRAGSSGPFGKDGGCVRGRSQPLLLERRGRDRACAPCAEDRGALPAANGYRVGEGRFGRQDLHPAGEARDREIPQIGRGAGTLPLEAEVRSACHGP